MFDEPERRQTLLQLYTPVFALISALEVSRDYGNPRDLAEKTKKLLDSVRANSQVTGKNMDWVADAQYAVVAFVDESINRSEWHGKEEWKRLPLSAMLGLQSNTGVLFFQKLEAWMQSPSPPAEVLEVFYTCIGLGFQGQYFTQQDTLARIKRELFQVLSEGESPPERLSPNADRKANERIDPGSDSFPWIWLVGIAVGALLIVFLVLKFLSVSEISKLVDALKS